MKKMLLSLCACCFNILTFATPTYPIHILAAENFYGDVAQSIGGLYVSVTSVQSSPSTDSHFFTPPANLEAMVNQANIIIENGAGYDGWMDQLYASSNRQAYLLNVAATTHLDSGFNPHIWYNPQTMPLFATALTNQLVAMDPNSAHQALYQQNLQAFLNRAELYQAQLNQIASQVGGRPVIATEPICNALLSVLNLKIINTNLEANLKDHAVDLLVFNKQIVSPTSEQLKALAVQSHVPVV